MTPLVIESFPLHGTSLIEASAGTGKTYTIVNLYLRLLLGHGCQPRSVEQILVVTFTNAATSELKDRIRSRVQSAYLDFFAGNSSDPFTQNLITQSQDVALDCQRLALAIKQMDDASVFTIHSFCQRTLSEHAFESGMNFDEQFEMDESQWVQLACQDFWRAHIVPLERNITEQISQLWPSPESLLAQIKPYLNRQWQSLQPVSITQAHQMFTQYCVALEKVKQWWVNDNIASQLNDAKLKGNTKLGKGLIVAQMSEFCHSTHTLCPFEKVGFSEWTNDKLAKAKPKASSNELNFDFTLIEELEHARLTMLDGVKRAYLEAALKMISENLASHKARLNLLAPNDLLERLQIALQGPNANGLKQVISATYPVALIDEFQDTDPIQFDIFNQVYQMSSTEVSDHRGLIMIGDPKQAIYGFRGADIFTYIEAKRLVNADRQFTLDTNWRSSRSLVEAVNHVFAGSEEGFLFEQDIPFQPVKGSQDDIQVEVDGHALAPLTFIHMASDGVCLKDSIAVPELALSFAKHIAQLLDSGQLIDSKSDQAKSIKAGDCCVLVRNRMEADRIKQALLSYNIASVFLARKSVFATPTAEDVYRILRALCEPHDERKLKAALASGLLCLSGTQLDELFSNEVKWQSIVEQFYLWQKSWQEKGIMLTLNSIMQHFDVFTRLLCQYQDGLRRLTDVRHVIELLQQQSTITPGENQLLQWLSVHLSEPDHNNDAQQLRLETDDNLVQIITMHASKGLEFPLVFVPFSATGKTAKEPIYNQPGAGSIVDFSEQEATLERADFERLAEDIRLFYVALTRAKIYSAVGVWCPCDGNRTTQTKLHRTAIGKLLLSSQQEPSDAALIQSIALLSQQASIAYFEVSDLPDRSPVVSDSQQDHESWQVAQMTRSIRRDWQLTSYSAIARDQQHPEWERPGRDEQEDSHVRLIDPEEPVIPSPFSFTKGAQAGSFLHGVLEQISFTDPKQISAVIEQQGKWFGIEEHWYPVVESWLLDILQTPLSEQESLDQLSLNALSEEQINVEMEFHMPLNQVKVADFNRIINQYFPTIHRQYGFAQLNGMLKGFIDLTFEYKGKFYVADYKSNYLGSDYDDYSLTKMQSAMDEHDYQLQSILYVLALHRLLRLHIPDYQYQRHIGGAFYLFLRGMRSDHAGSGCYFSQINETLINQLDRLFDGQPISAEDMEQLPLC